MSTSQEQESSWALPPNSPAKNDAAAIVRGPARGVSQKANPLIVVVGLGITVSILGVVLAARSGHVPRPALQVSVDLAGLAGTCAFLMMCAGAIERAVELLMTYADPRASTAQRRRRALSLALVFGSVLALAGVRILGPSVEAPTGDVPRALFIAVDIVLTACLMAAGSDVLHQYVEALLQFGQELRKFPPRGGSPAREESRGSRTADAVVNQLPAGYGSTVSAMNAVEWPARKS